MIDVAIMVGSTRPGRKGEAVTSGLYCPIPRIEPGRPLPAVQPPARTDARSTAGFDLLTISEVW
jgi:hypothetical protein